MNSEAGTSTTPSAQISFHKLAKESLLISFLLLQSSQPKERVTKALAYIRMAKKGAINEKQITVVAMLSYAQDFGSLKLDFTPGGGSDNGMSHRMIVCEALKVLNLGEII